MPAKEPFKFEVDINVINHLGIGLYSSTPAALTELVSNSWDADAKNVSLTVDPVSRSIVIEDDGHGMTDSDVRSKFLKVGYSRRKAPSGNKSDSGKRYVMGRKGIGKLAMFALAKHVTIETQAEGEDAVAMGVNVPEFQEALEAHDTYELESPTPRPFTRGHGTRITLTNVPVRLNTTEDHLRVRLARRFSVVDDAANFVVSLNGRAIRRQDRGFYEHVQLLWTFDDEYENRVKSMSPNIAKFTVDGDAITCVERLPNVVQVGSDDFSIQGYIASVNKPGNLGAGDNSANMISIFANGRVFAENVLDEINSAKVYQSYLVGEIHADFLDRDDTDRATASREAIKRDDPRYEALLHFLRNTLGEIGDQWDEWRIALAGDQNEGANAAVQEWLATLEPRDLKPAKRMVASIKNATIHADEIKNEAAKRVLYRGAIVGFERLRVRKQLDRLDAGVDVLSPEFAAIFLTLDQVEEAAYADIVGQRLEVIRKFKEIANDATSLEKVAQEHLFNHLWLLDPSWDRVGSGTEKEVTLTKYLKDEWPDSSGARLDISYRMTSGAHCVIELKRPSKVVPFDDIHTQVRKYATALAAYYSQKYPGTTPPPIDIVVLLGTQPSQYTTADVASLRSYRARIITYAEIINQSYVAYEEYLEASRNLGPLQGILGRV